MVPDVKITRRAAERLRAGHSWVYRSDLVEREQALPRGGLVHVATERGRFLGSALSSSASQIAMRMISDGALSDGEPLLKLVRERLRQAIDFRERYAAESDSYRVVFSDADLLPGLIVDRYNDLLVLQVLTQAMDREDVRAAVLETLQTALKIDDILERSDAKMREREQMEPISSRQLIGSRNETEFHLNGLAFGFRGFEGQKTGAFLDQRQNYAAVERYAHGRALDLCTYQGGFALHLARACHSVIAVDVSRDALETAEVNGVRNRDLLLSEVEWVQGDAFDVMRDWADARQRFDTIVIDPPAFAKSKRKAGEALKGYKELNLRALKMLESGGMLVSCSCSHHVSEEDFLNMLLDAANDAKRHLRLLERRTQAIDHPVRLGVPETQYLKCVIASVM